MFFRGGLVVLHKNFLTNFVWNGLRTKRSFPVHVEGKEWTNQISMFKSSTNQRNTGNHLGFPCPSGGKLWTPRSKFKIYCTSKFLGCPHDISLSPDCLIKIACLAFQLAFQLIVRTRNVINRAVLRCYLTEKITGYEFQKSANRIQIGGKKHYQ